MPAGVALNTLPPSGGRARLTAQSPTLVDACLWFVRGERPNGFPLGAGQALVRRRPCRVAARQAASLVPGRELASKVDPECAIRAMCAVLCGPGAVPERNNGPICRMLRAQYRPFRPQPIATAGHEGPAYRRAFSSSRVRFVHRVGPPPALYARRRAVLRGKRPGVRIAAQPARLVRADVGSPSDGGTWRWGRLGSPRPLPAPPTLDTRSTLSRNAATPPPARARRRKDGVRTGLCEVVDRVAVEVAPGARRGL